MPKITGRGHTRQVVASPLGQNQLDSWPADKLPSESALVRERPVSGKGRAHLTPGFMPGVIRITAFFSRPKMGTSGIAKRKGLYMATRPNLEQLKKQAREFLNTLVQGDSQARERLFDVHPKYRDPAAQGRQRPVLADAQLLLAREHGFPSWPRLKRFVDDLERVDREAEELRQAWLRGDEATREKVRLAKRPHFVGDRFENPGPGDELTTHDAHAVVAMEKGYSGWGKYESFLHLDPNVRDVIAAIRVGDLDRVRKILAEDPNASQSRWAGDYRPSHLGP